MSARTYIDNILPTVDKLTKSDSRAQHKTPLPSCYRPEEDTSDLLDDTGKKLYMRLIGILQWIVTIGRIDICYAVSSMSRFTNALEQNKLDMLQAFSTILDNTQIILLKCVLSI